MNRHLPVELPRSPVDAAALAVARDAEAELTAIAAPLAIVPDGDEAIGVAAHRTAWAEERILWTPRVTALHAIASAYAAIIRLRDIALGRPGNETLEHRARRVRETLAEARERVAALPERRRAA